MGTWKKKNKYQGDRVPGSHCIKCGRRKSSTSQAQANDWCATCTRRARNV
jgi:hypothetical protein